MSTGTQQQVFWEQQNRSFSEPTPACDLLHPEAREGETDPALTETQYFGFSVPEEHIHGLTYLWHHPNLGVVSGGVFAWRGVKRGPLEAELFDMITFASDECLAGDLYDYKLPNGYHVTTEEPMRRHRLRYADPSRGNALDISLEAVMPAMVLANGHHLEQAMRTTGELTLGAKTYPVEGYNVRDRTWSELRRDTLQPGGMPPIDWMTGAFGDDFSFGCTAQDNLESNPDWKGVIEASPGDPLKLGWVWRDGELTPLVSSRKRSRRSAGTLFPEAVEMELTDARGRTYEMKGTIVAACPWYPWPTLEAVICSVRWECEGRTTYGELQRGLRPDYIRAFRDWA